MGTFRLHINYAQSRIQVIYRPFQAYTMGGRAPTGRPLPRNSAYPSYGPLIACIVVCAWLMHSLCAT